MILNGTATCIDILFLVINSVVFPCTFTGIHVAWSVRESHIHVHYELSVSWS